jgi:hypothetical protein
MTRLNRKSKAVGYAVESSNEITLSRDLIRASGATLEVRFFIAAFCRREESLSYSRETT